MILNNDGLIFNLGPLVLKISKAWLRLNFLNGLEYSM